MKNDFVYDVVVTKMMDYLVTLRTLKVTRTHLKEIRARLGAGVSSYGLPGGMEIEFDLSTDLDAFMYDHLLRYGHYEAEVESALSGLITEETTFLDVGANIGYFTVLLSRLARNVYAFEPVPGVFERLSRNVSLNRLRNVRAFQCAVSRRSSRLTIYESKISPGHDSTVKRFEHDTSILVDSVSLDETVEPSAEKIVMKVDVEGAEMDVLLGASGLIGSGRVSAIVLEWARGIYPHITDLRERFALYSSLGDVEVLDSRRGSYKVSGRQEVPDFCNLLIRVRN